MGISTPVCKLVKVSFNKLFCSCALHVAARALLFYPAKIITITEYIGEKESKIYEISLNNISSCKVFRINCTQIYLFELNISLARYLIIFSYLFLSVQKY